MQPPVEYPVLLVSAVDQSTATEFITELMNGEESEASQNPQSPIWQINNKYYSASVQVYTILDDDDEAKTSSDSSLSFDEALKRAEAHVVVLSSNEEWPVAEKRISHVSSAHRLEVLLCVGVEDSVRAGYECVERGGEGVERAREALQAHRWSGLQLHQRQGNGLDAILSALSSDEDEHSNEDNEAEQWEQLEQFDAIVEQAAWLSTQAGQARQAADFSDESEEQREVRLRRAEELLAAFCRITDLTQ